jgi:hypothetical protein
MTKAQYVAMIEAWPRTDILRCFRAARISAMKIATNHDLAAPMSGEGNEHA